MCGILGQISFNVTKPIALDLKSIAHRGPDGHGEWVNKDKTVYFGHTRLAILDLSPTGHQPMQDASGRYTITFNGEIYNHLDLRDLIPGVKWRGNSDTETLVELFASKRLKCLELLNGMFAFAIHDADDNSVYLVRDRLGIKPLWLRTTKDHVSFSSEVRSLITSDQSAPNTAFLNEYIGFGHAPSTGDIIVGIESLAPGSWYKVQSDGKTERKLWWPKAYFPKTTVQNKKEAANSIKAHVNRSIREHLISDVGVASFLSGGIDSSIITLVAGKELGKNLQTFTVGFPQGDFDERAIARKVAKQAGAEHTEIEIREEDCLAWVKQAVNSLDLPSVDAINTYIVSKAVKAAGVKVALSGLGGDELFAGYPSFKNIPMLNGLGKLPLPIAKMLMSMAPQLLQEKFSGLSSYDTYELTRNRRRFTGLKTLSSQGFGYEQHTLHNYPKGLDTMGKISWAEIQSYMIPMLLRDSDQMSMAVGLEIRVPFLDHLLVEEVLVLPQRFKKGKGIKPLLVEAFKDELPGAVYDRPKQGFELPMGDWIRGPLATFTNFGVKAASDNLGLKAPLELKIQFDNGKVHWTRVWHWCVLGHWLNNQKILGANTKATVS